MVMKAFEVFSREVIFEGFEEKGRDVWNFQATLRWNSFLENNCEKYRLRETPISSPESKILPKTPAEENEGEIVFPSHNGEDINYSTILPKYADGDISQNGGTFPPLYLILNVRKNCILLQKYLQSTYRLLMMMAKMCALPPTPYTPALFTDGHIKCKVLPPADQPLLLSSGNRWSVPVTFLPDN
ncbi:hypothetical protein CEXT_724151 [Caerostris extrusa]|uniref:Uncharacterized protein n=1 Tax=Caerostris extrusa TaxID=172846 RepID=A0AAV4PCM7_CAEEX|nr:hypothetical protein CEXT_724151 [Caerostris extrusa]